MIVAVPAATAFDFVGWAKKVLGIQEPEESTEIFVPIDEIEIEGEEEPEVDEEEVVEEETSEEEETAEEEEVIVEEIVVEEIEEEETEEEEVVEEIVVEEVAEVDEDAKVVIVEETELVSLETKAEDPDSDDLDFEYTSPLNDIGQWQTNYGDAGEYTVTVSVSDGTLSDSQDVLIIVNRREESPAIDAFEPTELMLDDTEDSQIEFGIDASDLNDDELTYTWLLDDEEVSTSRNFLYDMDFNSAGEHTIKIVVSDGLLETTKVWSVSVENVNRLPELDEISDIAIMETDTVVIEPSAVDPDGQEMIYTISSPVGDDGVWDTTYDDAGEYDIVVTASDGEDEVSQTITITVENVNRAPVINDIIQK